MEFMIGCNYWASNAGADMWADWDERAVDLDLKTLSSYGIKYLRVFPNWRDFQPVCAFYNQRNVKEEYRHKNGSFFDNPYYLDNTMLDRFEKFCEIAAKYGMKLIVGLITGWMSGRTFTPPLLEGKNLHTDQMAQMMEQRFIKGFVSRFYDKGVICAWDLGNECNCLSDAGSREAATVWTAMIVNAIKANDPLHKPVVSGLHGININTNWNVFDHGEEVDILTTHPYPHFVKYCFKDHMTAFRTLLHATCQGRYYSDLGGKPCLTEEIGSLGPMTCDDETSAAFLKTNLYSNWANGSLGVLWWCGCEQVELKTAPYTWCMMERELGLMDLERKPRETLLTYEAFSKWLERFGKELPPAKRDALCVLTVDQEQWGVAYMAYALAKQAHVNLQFYYGQMTGELPDSPVYLLPSIAGTNVLRKETLDQILQKVKKGATLYISNDTGYLAEFEKYTGVHVVNSMMIPETCSMEFVDVAAEKIQFTRNKRNFIQAKDAHVLAYDNLRMPAFTKHQFGEGWVYYVNFPLESMLFEENFAFDSNRYKIYDRVFAEVKEQQPLKLDNPFVGVTFHEAEDTCYAVLINYTESQQTFNLTVKEDYRLLDIYPAEAADGTEVKHLQAHEAVVLTLAKR